MAMSEKNCYFVCKKVIVSLWICSVFQKHNTTIIIFSAWLKDSHSESGESFNFIEKSDHNIVEVICILFISDMVPISTKLH